MRNETFQMNLIFGILLLVSVVQVHCLDNGVALTPPMGFMTWQRFRCLIDCQAYPDECISEDLIKNMAKLMVTEGYLAAGYEYIIIDDCWSSHKRDGNNELQPNPERFPSGIPALSEYVHSLGLKFGIYGDFGTFTCGGYPGSIEHLKIDAQTFAKWGVDYIKLDGCFAEEALMEDGYAEFGRYLNETGRPIVYSCSWPAYFEGQHMEVNFEKLKNTCNLWRNWGDIQDSWASLESIIHWFGENQDRFSNYSGPGHWNDPDMLLIGNFGLSLYQSQTQMAVWSIMAAPLLMSVDLRTIRPAFKEILLNQDAIAINQDPLGIMGRLVYQYNDLHVWMKPILPVIEGHYTVAVGFINRNRDYGYPLLINVALSKLWQNLSAPNGYYVENIFEVENTDIINEGVISVRVPPSGTVFLRLTPKSTS